MKRYIWIVLAVVASVIVFQAAQARFAPASSSGAVAGGEQRPDIPQGTWKTSDGSAEVVTAGGHLVYRKGTVTLYDGLYRYDAYGRRITPERGRRFGEYDYFFFADDSCIKGVVNSSGATGEFFFDPGT